MSILSILALLPDALTALGSAPGRTAAIDATLHQVAALPTNGGRTAGDERADILADAFMRLAAPADTDPPPIVARRKTCGDLAAAFASVGAGAGTDPHGGSWSDDSGHLARWWFLAQIAAWSDATDPRQRAMADTARREATELGIAV